MLYARDHFRPWDTCRLTVRRWKNRLTSSFNPHCSTLPASGWACHYRNNFVLLSGIPWRQSLKQGVRCRWLGDDSVRLGKEMEWVTQEEGTPQKRWVIDLGAPVGDWGSCHWGLRNSIDYSSGVSIEEGAWNVPSWAAGWHFMVVEKFRHRALRKSFRNLKENVVPPSTTGLRSGGYKRWCGAQKPSALGGRSFLDWSMANIRPHCAIRTHICC